MFTGLIQALGMTQLVSEDRVQVTYHPNTDPTVFQDLTLGDSVAVDGVCLTVTNVLPQGFIAVISPETLHRSTLDQAGAKMRWVNLEPSLRVGSKLGGHFVTGHVDGLGVLQSIVQTQSSWELSVTIPSAVIARYIVFKGSIAMNGISLTVAECSESGRWFKVAVIPHTFAVTNLHLLQPGDTVNLEGDILGKYAEKFLRIGSGSAVNSLAHNHNLDWHNPDWSEAPDTMAETVSATFLAENGYL
jgi:riboflavin synthase